MQNKNYKIIVAHPDDEAIFFFSSILKNASKVILCFTETQDSTVNIGRKHLKTQIPLKIIYF